MGGDSRPRPRRLTSISNLAKSIGLRRSNNYESLGEGANNNKQEKRSVLPSRLRKPSSPPPGAGIPRSATFSSIPRPVSGQKAANQRLPSSKTSTSLVPSRIPTPGGHRRQDRTDNYTPTPSLPPLPKRNKAKWHQSETSLLSPSNTQDTPDTKPPQLDLDPRDHSPTTSQWSLEYACPTEDPSPTKATERAPSEMNTSTHGTGFRPRLRPGLYVGTNLKFSSQNSKQDQSPRSPASSGSPRKSHEVVHRRLLQPVDATKQQPPSSSSSPKGSDQQPAGKSSVYKTILLSENILKPTTNISSPFTATVKSKLSKLTSQNFMPRSSTFSGSIPNLSSESLPDGIVYEAQPSAYWTGRFVALNDKHLQQHQKDEFCKPSQGNQETFMRMKEVQRTQLIFEQLEAKCATKAAQKSLHQFKKAFASNRFMPELLTRTSSISINSSQSSICVNNKGINSSDSIETAKKTNENERPVERHTITRKPLPTNSSLTHLASVTAPTVPREPSIDQESDETEALFIPSERKKRYGMILDKNLPGIRALAEVRYRPIHGHNNRGRLASSNQ